MNCEQFETIGLDLDRESLNGLDAIERAAAIDHANGCARCAALQESWRDAQIELQALRDVTADVGAPWNWHISNENINLQGAASGKNDASISASAKPAAATTGNPAVDNYPTEPANEATLVAANDAEDFTLLPGSMAQEIGDGSVVRVRMQRGALGDLGLPVNEERANEWIQVDLFVGQDGQPQAVRLPQAQ